MINYGQEEVFDTGEVLKTENEELNREVIDEDKFVKEGEKLLLSEPEKDRITEENYRLVFFVAQMFQSIGIPFDELESIAQVGFVKALNAFDANKNVKFSTFSINCMKNEILFFLRKEKQHMYNNISLNKVLAVDKNGNDLSLEDTLSGSEGKDNMLEDDFLLQEDIKLLQESLNELTEKEQLIIKHRYGLGTASTKTQKQIAEEIGMSQANISKLERTILSKLKKILMSKHIGKVY